MKKAPTFTYNNSCFLWRWKNQKLVSSGNYDAAISKAVSNLRTNKDNKGNRIISIYWRSICKSKRSDLNAINLLAKDANPAQLEKMYNIYLQLNERQEKIKPLLLCID
jgi:hypothetical protein